MTAMRFTGALLALVTSILGGDSLALSAPGPPEARAPRPPRLVLAFYYPWYGSPTGPGGKPRGNSWVHWEGVDTDAKTIASSTNYPVLGAYDSHDPTIIAEHCRLAKKAGIDGFIVSWWGNGTFEDQAMRPVLDGCKAAGLEACIYYEQVPRKGTPESVAGEIVDLAKKFGSDPAYLTIDREGVSRPVFFVYGRAIEQLTIDGWGKVRWILAARSSDAGAPRPFTIGDNFSDQALKAFDGAHSYAPMGDWNAALKKGETLEHWTARAMPWWADHPREKGKLSTITVFPGYDDTKVRKPGMKVDRDDGTLYRTLWDKAIAADPDWILITSFNEWHEGSEIEPSLEHAEKYMDITAEGASRFKSKNTPQK